MAAVKQVPRTVLFCLIVLVLVTVAQSIANKYNSAADADIASRIHRYGRCAPVGTPCLRSPNARISRCCYGAVCVISGRSRHRGGRGLYRRRHVRIGRCVSIFSGNPPAPSPSISPSATPSVSPPASPPLDCLSPWFDPSIQPTSFAELSALTDGCAEGGARSNEFNFIAAPAPVCISTCGSILFKPLFFGSNRITGGIVEALDCLAGVAKTIYPYDSESDIPLCSSVPQPGFNGVVNLMRSMDTASVSEACNAPLDFLVFRFEQGSTALSLAAALCDS